LINIKRYSDKKILILIISASLVIKLALFAYAAVNAPDAKFMPDTKTYLEPGKNLIEKGSFATFDGSGNIIYERSRTPGYPIFLAFLKYVLKLPFNAIILVQILLITLAGYIVYKAAHKLDGNIALLAAFIFLFDQPTTISALMLLSEALCTVFTALFMYFFLKYLRDRGLGRLVVSALMLAAATYIRPAGYYLGIYLAIGVIYALSRVNLKKGIIHALIFFLLFYSMLGTWQCRNYLRSGYADFSTIVKTNIYRWGPLHKYERDGGYEATKMSPFAYYPDLVTRMAIQYFTVPGTLKYLKSEGLKAASKVYGYPWVVFWLVGLIFARYDKLSSRFLISVILYFAAGAILITGLTISSRYRVPTMPMISILSASGWIRLAGLLHSRLRPGSGP